jgi:hypothetical protein
VLVYENSHRPSRAYAVAERGDLRIVGFDGGAAPDRLALERTVARDLNSRFHQLKMGGPDAMSLSDLLPHFGISPMTDVKTNRGAKGRWDGAALREFATDYIASGDMKGLGRRQTLEVMRRAEEAGHVTVVRPPGRRNEYRLLPSRASRPVPVVPGDTERDQWFGLRRFAVKLDENWRRQVSRPSESTTESRIDVPG